MGSIYNYFTTKQPKFTYSIYTYILHDRDAQVLQIWYFSTVAPTIEVL